MNKSDKQKRKERMLSEYKKLHPKYCVLCGRQANDLCHLLPRSLWPEYVTEPENLVIMCRSCHTDHDDRIAFRTLQTKLYNQVCKFDEQAANKYYRR